jgi:hypothetical protein
MAPLKLSRRATLKGLGGVAVALPVLEIMLDGRRSIAAEPTPLPKRYLVCFAGSSLGGDFDSTPNMLVPDATGTGYDVKAGLQPIAEAGVTDRVSVISGLRIPTGPTGSIPAGGRTVDFHVKSLSPTFSGVRSTDGDESVLPVVNGPTSDVLVGNAIGAATTFQNLAFRAQVSYYLSGGGPYGRELMSYTSAGNGIAPTTSPREAFNKLFGNFIPPDNQARVRHAAFVQRERKSVVDLVKSHADALVKRLGGADQRRIQQHLDELRALELQIAALPPVPAGQCQPPASPGDDPAVGGDNSVMSQAMGSGYSTSNGYSDEDARARAFCDLIHMAFTCDLTRSVSMMFTMAQSHLNMYPVTGQPADVHQIGHNGLNNGVNSTAEVAKVLAWHTKHFGYLVKKLRDTTEADGSVLDRSALVMLFEGGHGSDPSTGDVWSTHSTENMACLVAGGAGGLQQGQHLATAGLHPANVLVTAMQAVGVQTNTLGEVSGTVPGLLAS